MLNEINWHIILKPQKYSKILKFLEQQVNLRIQDKIKDSIYLLEHTPVFTAGRSYHTSEILDQNLKIIQTNRGGKITFHSPGQRIIYPIIKLDNANYKKDLHQFIELMERWLINSLLKLKVSSYKLNNKVGIWTKYMQEDYKIAYLGFRVRKWTIYHGISINICNDLTYFNKIIPCGIKGLKNISLKELGTTTDYNIIDRILIIEFHQLFNFYQNNMNLDLKNLFISI